MSELTAAERSAVESIVLGVHRRSAKRHQAARTGYALLATAVISVPVVNSALGNAITTTTALTRIGIALVLSLFVSSAIGSLIDGYQRQAAYTTVEHAVITARKAAASADSASPATPSTPEGVADGPDVAR